MGWGGARRGAGRKPGIPNRVTQEMRAEVAATGETPLEYLLRVMRDPAAPDARRDKAATDAAPYVHSRLASVDASLQANLDGSITFTWMPEEPVGDGDKPVGDTNPL